MKYILLVSILLLTSCSNNEQFISEELYKKYINNTIDEYYPPEFKYKATNELQDIWVSLSWAVKYEVLLHKETKKVFDSNAMKYIDKVVYYHSDEMYPKYRVTFSSWSVWYYYLQPYIQWWYDLLPDNEVQ